MDPSGPAEFLHTMIRVKDLTAAVHFFGLLGLKETRRIDNPAGKFTLVFLATEFGEPEIELTFNYDQEASYTSGRNFGHLAYAVSDIYALCEQLQEAGVQILRPPRDGRMAFVRSPDNISVELLQKGDALAVKEPWKSMPNVGEW
jgi:lactoylglutathione lyase